MWGTQVAEENNSIAKGFRAVVRWLPNWLAYLYVCEMMCCRHNEFITARLQAR